MAGRDPEEIWQQGVDEGARRLHRRPVGLLSTGFIGGVDVMFGIMALTVVSGALAVSLPEQIAHLGGSLVFGIGFVFLLVGRSELFTENFLVPLAAVYGGRARPWAVARLWVITAIGNVVGLFLLAAVFTRAGLVPPETLDAAGKLADTLAERDVIAAGLSAIVAGIAMTLMTWLAHAVERDTARIAIALLIGFVLAAPSLNHAIVSIGEFGFALLADTPEKATWTDMAQNTPIAIAGNLLGGVLFVTLARVLQVRDEPDVAEDREDREAAA